MSDGFGRGPVSMTARRGDEETSSNDDHEYRDLDLKMGEVTKALAGVDGLPWKCMEGEELGNLWRDAMQDSPERHPVRVLAIQLGLMSGRPAQMGTASRIGRSGDRHYVQVGNQTIECPSEIEARNLTAQITAEVRRLLLPTRRKLLEKIASASQLALPSEPPHAVACGRQLVVFCDDRAEAFELLKALNGAYRQAAAPVREHYREQVTQLAREALER